MNIFITGATGFLGGRLVRSLIPSGHHLYLLVRSPKKVQAMYTEAERKAITVVEGDLTSPMLGVSSQWIEQYGGKVDLFIHMAAIVKFDQNLREELFEANYEGTKQALALAEQLRCPRFFHVSTAYTLGDRERGIEQIYGERSFSNPYEESKSKAEQAVWAARDHLDVSIFRPAIIVGDSKTGEADSKFTMYGYMKALELFKRRMQRSGNWGDVIRLYGDKEGTSNIVPVDYVADVLLAAIEHAEPNTIYNVTNDAPPENESMLNLIREALEFPHLEISNVHPAKLTAAEQYFNDMVKVFNPYMSRRIVFEDTNTKRLLKKANETPLALREESYRRIVDAYYKTK